MSFFSPAYYGDLSTRKSGMTGMGISLLVHGLIGAALVLGLTQADRLEELARPIAVSLLETAQPRPPVPQPKPVAPPVQKTKIPPLTQPMPVAVATSSTPSSAPSGVLAAPPAAVAPASEGPLAEARFDADYLSNPKPPYPLASRRLNEAGTVYLRVHVSVEGTALTVDLKKSSGFPRLDQSAQETVARWRFVPARRGSQPVASWVVVPVVFSLT